MTQAQATLVAPAVRRRVRATGEQTAEHDAASDVGVARDVLAAEVAGLRALGQSLDGACVRAVDTLADALAAEALHAMTSGPRRITTLFVVEDGGVPVGILHIHDLLRAGAA